MSQKPFQFKQFTIQQDRCAMKISTDGVLLGAWAPTNNSPFSILDIGAGTGLLSLMLAQRTNAELIDAIEIDDNAYEQCVENFETSPWGDRLFCYHAGFDEFVDEIDDQYDLILSNPPFYTENYTTNNKQRDLARFSFSLPFEELITGVAKLLTQNGTFSVILPYKEEENFIALAKKVNLFPFKITHVKGNPSTEIKRVLIAFSFQKKTIKTTELIIERERHQYTKAYKEITKDFYLNF